MRTRGFTQKKYHLENNLWVCGFQSVYNTYDETIEHSEFQKYKDKPRYLEIITELCCSFLGSYEMIPIEIIGNFNGFEEDDLPDEPGWFLGICAKSKFLEEETANTKKYNGPGKDWYKEAMLWWYENEDPKRYDLLKLATGYANYAVRERNKKLIDMCRYQTNCQTLNESVVRYIVKTYNPNRLISFIEGMNPMELYFLMYFIDDSNFDNFLEYHHSPNPEMRERYDYKRHLEIAAVIDKEIAKYK